MKEFHLQIATPDGIRFDGAAESLLVKCESGDVEIMAGHADLFASLGIGRARIKTKDGERTASCAGGFLTVSGGEATMIATTLEFADEIDVDRALAAKAGAEETIKTSRDDIALEKAKLKLSRALNRIKVAEQK
jgi:F-type H+-transporting ATPase subunit epsilon